MTSNPRQWDSEISSSSLNYPPSHTPVIQNQSLTRSDPGTLITSAKPFHSQSYRHSGKFRVGSDSNPGFKQYPFSVQFQPVSSFLLSIYFTGSLYSLSYVQIERDRMPLSPFRDIHRRKQFSPAFYLRERTIFWSVRELSGHSFMALVNSKFKHWLPSYHSHITRGTDLRRRTRRWKGKGNENISFN